MKKPIHYGFDENLPTTPSVCIEVFSKEDAQLVIVRNPFLPLEALLQTLVEYPLNENASSPFYTQLVIVRSPFLPLEARLQILVEYPLNENAFSPFYVPYHQTMSRFHLVYYIDGLRDPSSIDAIVSCFLFPVYTIFLFPPSNMQVVEHSYLLSLADELLGTLPVI